MEMENSLSFSMFVSQTEFLSLQNSSKYLTYGDWRDQCQYSYETDIFDCFSGESIRTSSKAMNFNDWGSLKQTTESIQWQDGEFECPTSPPLHLQSDLEDIYIEAPQNLKKVFSVTRVKSIGDRKKNSSNDICFNNKQSSGSTKIRRDVVNKGILRALRKYYRKALSKLNKETRIYDSPKKFLEAYKEQIFEYWVRSGVLEQFLMKNKDQNQDLINELVDILCWLVIPQCHHSLLKTQLYTCDSIQVLDKIYRRYSHKELTEVFKIEPLMHLFSHFCMNGLDELNLGNNSLEKDNHYQQAIEDFKMNFQNLF